MLLEKLYRDYGSYVKRQKLYLYLPSGSEMLYPIDLSFTLDDMAYYYMPFDDNGIPMKSYSSVGIRYNPTRICSFALASFNRYIDAGQEGDRQNFLRMADFLLSFSEGKFEYDFDWNDLKAPWLSCMAQGEAVSVLVRASLLTGQAKYADGARLALCPLNLPIEDGGLQSRLNNGAPFLEEYPSAKPVHVLNGFLYCLIGLLEFRKFVEEIELADKMSESLCANLHLWNMKGWSLYDLGKSKGLRNPSTPYYHQIHISQLYAVNNYINNSHLREVAVTWDRSLSSLPIRLSNLYRKMHYRALNRAQR